MSNWKRKPGEEVYKKRTRVVEQVKCRQCGRVFYPDHTNRSALSGGNKTPLDICSTTCR